MFDRMVNQLSAAAANTSSNLATGGGTGAQAAAALMKFSGLTANAEKKQEKANEDPVLEEDGQLSLDAAGRMMKWHAEAVGRCVALTTSNDVYVHSTTEKRLI